MGSCREFSPAPASPRPRGRCAAGAAPPQAASRTGARRAPSPPPDRGPVAGCCMGSCQEFSPAPASPRPRGRCSAGAAPPQAASRTGARDMTNGLSRWVPSRPGRAGRFACLVLRALRGTPALAGWGLPGQAYASAPPRQVVATAVVQFSMSPLAQARMSLDSHHRRVVRRQTVAWGRCAIFHPPPPPATSPLAAAAPGAHRRHRRRVVRRQTVAWGCGAIFHRLPHDPGRRAGIPPPPPATSPLAAAAPGAHCRHHRRVVRRQTVAWGRCAIFRPHPRCRDRTADARPSPRGARPPAAPAPGAHRPHHRIVVRWQAVAWGLAGRFRPRPHPPGHADGAPPALRRPRRPAAPAPGTHRPHHRIVVRWQAVAWAPAPAKAGSLRGFSLTPGLPRPDG